MNMKNPVWAAWALAVAGVCAMSGALAADKEAPREWVTVKSEGKDGLQFLRDYDARFRSVLNQKRFPAGDLECVGCDELAGKGGTQAPTELNYLFPAAATSGFTLALVEAWLQTTPRTAGKLVLEGPVPTCNNYPQPCYNRTPYCRTNPTPYCSKNATGACLPGCL